MSFPVGSTISGYIPGLSIVCLSLAKNCHLDFQTELHALTCFSTGVGGWLEWNEFDGFGLGGGISTGVLGWLEWNEFDGFNGLGGGFSTGVVGWFGMDSMDIFWVGWALFNWCGRVVGMERIRWIWVGWVSMKDLGWV